MSVPSSQDILLVDSIVELRRSARDAAPELSRTLHDIEQRLCELVPVSLPKGVAAQVLGVSTTAVDDLTKRGLLLRVIRPDTTRTHVEMREVVQLAIAVRDLRDAGATRGMLMAALRRLGWPTTRPGPVDISLETAGLPRPNQDREAIRDTYLRTSMAERYELASRMSRQLSRFHVTPMEAT